MNQHFKYLMIDHWKIKLAIILNAQYRGRNQFTNYDFHTFFLLNCLNILIWADYRSEEMNEKSLHNRWIQKKINRVEFLRNQEMKNIATQYYFSSRWIRTEIIVYILFFIRFCTIEKPTTIDRNFRIVMINGLIT